MGENGEKRKLNPSQSLRSRGCGVIPKVINPDVGHVEYLGTIQRDLAFVT